MYQRFILLASLFIYQAVNGQQTVKLKSGIFNTAVSLKAPLNAPQEFNSVLFKGKYYLWIQFSHLPGTAMLQFLKNEGVDIYGYLPEKTYVAAIPVNFNYSKLQMAGINGIILPPVSSKIDPQVSAKLESTAEEDIQISFISAISKTELTQLLRDAFPSISLYKPSGSNTIRLVLPGTDIIKLASHPLVHYIEVGSAMPALDNEEATSNHRINMLRNENGIGPWNYTGRGVHVALGDDGGVGPHIDFQGRIKRNFNAGGTHGDHTAGIIVSSSNMNPVNKGQAPGALLHAYSYYDDFFALPELYDSDSIRVTSHSLGQTCNAGYDGDARESDIQTLMYPLIMHVHSAGNSGGSTCDVAVGRGFKTITGGYKQGKNIIATANLQKDDIRYGGSSGSSQGPSRDGRIKPDIAAVGTSVISTQPKNKYSSLTGTSMACPAIAGILAVMNEAYQDIHGVEPTGAFLKALLLNTADDQGNAGPDFSYGWGRVNAMRALECIEQNRFSSGTIEQGEEQNLEINIPENVAIAKIMVYWNDQPALASPVKALVNDIDISMSNNGNIFPPWLMDAGESPTQESCKAPAIKGEDHLNNVEQIQIDNPDAGTYTLTLKGTSIPLGPQTYYIIIDYISQNKITMTYPFGGESFVPGETQRIRWDASPTTENFSLSFSTDSGQTWTNIPKTIAADTRFFDWIVPENLSGKIWMRVASNTVSDETDYPFYILGTPSDIRLTEKCANTSIIKWSLVPGADGYEVMRLGEKYMEVITTSSVDSAIVENTGLDTLKYYTVRAVLGSDVFGRRSIAVSHTNTSTVDCLLPVNLLSFTGQKNPEGIQLYWRTSGEINVTEYRIERATTPEFTGYETVGVLPANNLASVNQYQLLDEKIYGGSRYYYRLKTVEKDRTHYSSVLEFDVSDLKSGWRAYPNPVLNYFTIEARGLAGNFTVQLFDLYGNLVQSNTIRADVNGSLTVNLGNLKAASYILRVMDVKTGNVIYRTNINKM